MSRAWRAFYGAAFTALLVLLIHPVSRPFLLTALTRWGTSQTFLRSPLILDNHGVLPKPSNALNASLWMEAGVSRLSQKHGIDRDTCNKLIRVADYAAGQDPDNAYWHQMEGVFYDAESKLPGISAPEKIKLRQQVLREWRVASNANHWDDYQTARLRGIQSTLAAESNGVASWQYAAVYPLRASDPARFIRTLAREILKGLDLDTPSSLMLRYETLMNGKLLREGARSVVIGQIGSEMVEISYYPRPPGRQVLGPKKLILARTDFFHKLANLGRSEKDPHLRGEFAQAAGQVNDVFNKNEAWLAFSQRDDVETRTQDLRLSSLLTISIPGALLAISSFGGLLWLMSAVLRAKPQLLKVVEPPIAPALGIVLAIILYRATELPLASIAVVACFGFLAFTPIHERSKPPEQLGPVFELTLFMLSCVLAVFGIAFFVGLSTPGSQVLPEMGIPKEFYGGSTLLLGLSGIVLGLLLLAAPCWAIVQRISTPAVVVLSLRQFGRGLLLGCLAAAIVATPLCIIADKYLQTQLNEIVANEPYYYQLND